MPAPVSYAAIISGRHATLFFKLFGHAMFLPELFDHATLNNGYE